MHVGASNDMHTHQPKVSKRQWLIFTLIIICHCFVSPYTDPTVRTEATSEVELEERQGPAFFNMVLGTSGSGE